MYIPSKVTRYDPNYFGEGITPLDDITYIALTWQERKFLLIDRETLLVAEEVDYPPEIREGWGITHNATHLFITDGSYNMHVI